MKKLKYNLFAVFVSLALVIGLSPYANAAGQYSNTSNSQYSDHRILVATGVNGGGTRFYMDPGTSTQFTTNADVDSVYIYYTSARNCMHTINGNKKDTIGWYNVRDWAYVQNYVRCSS